jgi:hypothetical protein
VICAVQKEVAGSPSWLVTIRQGDIAVTSRTQRARPSPAAPTLRRGSSRGLA